MTTPTKSRLTSIVATLESTRTADADTDHGGLVVFGIMFEDYNAEEDRDSDDPDAQARYQEFLALGNGDDVWAAIKCEDLFVAELAKKFSDALGRPVRINNEGHNNYEFVCKFALENKDEIRKAVETIDRISYNNEGCTASMDAPYVEARGWRIEVWDGKGREKEFEFDFQRDELDEYLESNGTTASVKRAEKEPYVCGDCGGEDVQEVMWVDINTNEVLDSAAGVDQYFCPQCEGHPRAVVLKSQYKG